MANNTTHIIGYRSLALHTLGLLALTLLAVLVASLHLGALAVTATLTIACIKAYIVLTHFMHLKYESVLLRILVAFVFILYVVIILITFIDYAYR